MRKVKVSKIELIKLRKRLQSFKRVHQLLKDRYEILVKEFIKLLKELKQLEEQYNRSIRNIKRNLTLVRLLHGDLTSSPLFNFKLDMDLQVTTKNIYGVEVPETKIDVKVKELKLDIKTPIINEFFSNIKDFIKVAIKIAFLRNAIEVIGQNIRELQKRINALEKVLIPDIEDKIRYIQQRLDDLERETKVTIIHLKKVKE